MQSISYLPATCVVLWCLVLQDLNRIAAESKISAMLFSAATNLVLPALANFVVTNSVAKCGLRSQCASLTISIAGGDPGRVVASVLEDVKSLEQVACDKPVLSAIATQTETYPKRAPLQ